MIEIGIALAAATKSVELIRQGVKLGQDTKTLSSEFAKFCDFKDDIAQAQKERQRDDYLEKYNEKQIRKHAMDLAMAEDKAREMEDAIRRAFFSVNKMDVYFRMIEIQKQETKRWKLAKSRQLAKRRDDSLTGKDVTYIMLFFLFSVAVIGGVIFMIIAGEANAQSWWEAFQLLEEGPSCG